MNLSKIIRFWKWKKTISKTISASATANVYLKRVYVSQNLKLQFIGEKIKVEISYLYSKFILNNFTQNFCVSFFLNKF